MRNKRYTTQHYKMDFSDPEDLYLEDWINEEIEDLLEKYAKERIDDANLYHILREPIECILVFLKYDERKFLDYIHMCKYDERYRISALD